MANSVSRQLIKDEVLRRGWRWDTFGADAYFCIITDTLGRSEILRGTQPMRTSANGFLIAKYKHLTASFIKELGYAVPAFLVVNDNQSALDFLTEHKRIVVKPVDGARSEGVTVGIETEEQLLQVIPLALASSKSKRVILQPHLEGNLYRVMVLNGKFVAAVQREAAQVTGDGVRNISQLIAGANTDPRRGSGSDSVLKTIKLSAAADLLGQDGLLAVPEAGQTVKVCAIDSISAGGEAINVTETAHPTWRRAVEDIASQAGLFLCGYDIMCPDIAQPLPESPDPIPIIEMNSMPGLKLLHFPTGGGEPINFAAMLLDELFSVKQ